MADVFTKKKRSEVMSLIRSKNTKPEIAFRKLVSSVLYPRGYRYRLHYKKIPGRPDVAFVAQKVAFFVDGTFWHGHDLKRNRGRLPSKFWISKIEGNVRRDKKINRQLRKMGWKVIRVWEHDLQKRPEWVLDNVLRALGA